MYVCAMMGIIKEGGRFNVQESGLQKILSLINESKLLVLMSDLEQLQSTHKVEKIVYSLDDITDLITGKKVVVGKHRDDIEEANCWAFRRYEGFYGREEMIIEYNSSANIPSNSNNECLANNCFNGFTVERANSQHNPTLCFVLFDTTTTDYFLYYLK
ncbi:hypothetical protein GQX74_009583 [Glossina fuscipes]|nr:hypothetical protein GQX74_009583 [Glossina fuscipes]